MLCFSVIIAFRDIEMIQCWIKIMLGICRSTIKLIVSLYLFLQNNLFIKHYLKNKTHIYILLDSNTYY